MTMGANGSVRNRDVGWGGYQRLGMVVSGSLTEGMEVRLDADTSIEDIKVGTFVNIQGQHMRFFGVVTDVALASMDPALPSSPPDVSNPFIARVVSGTAAYGTITVEPMLTLGAGESVAGLDGPQPAKTIPPHFSAVGSATDEDIRVVFGSEDDRHFWIGSPLDMDTQLCLDIEELVTRSNGVFGKSGTGKTFLTRLLLAGILQKNVASNLVFDMHNEYGWQGTSEGATSTVKGLKQLFSSRVAVFTLDEQSSRRRGINPDYVARIGLEEIEPEDILMLRESLNLSEVAADATYSLQREFGRKWLGTFLDMSGGEEMRELASRLNVNDRALSTLQNRLNRLMRLPFIDAERAHDSVNRILDYVQNQDMHVVLEFGRYGSDLSAYILVANLLTRRIYARYQDLTEKAAGDSTQSPRPLVITIEEAHKFMSPGIADQTIFGTIAREMRKFNVTLLVVDQRPSGIDGEIMSQIGTKLTCLLDSDRDVDAVLSGVSGSRKLRAVLSRLESKQQALVFGHALPMPVVVRTRDYGSSESYASFGWRDESERLAMAERDAADLF